MNITLKWEDFSFAPMWQHLGYKEGKKVLCINKIREAMEKFYVVCRDKRPAEECDLCGTHYEDIPEDEYWVCTARNHICSWGHDPDPKQNPNVLLYRTKEDANTACMLLSLSEVLFQIRHPNKAMVDSVLKGVSREIEVLREVTEKAWLDMLQAKVDELLDAVPKSVREEKYGW